MKTLKKYTEKVIHGESLSFTDAYECMHSIGTEEISEIEISALLIALQFRSLELNELLGFQAALLDLAIPLELESSSEAIDVCGTGGDNKNTFNISTISAFVLASMGYKVIKHGNYGVSSICGSSTVLENLGIRFTTDASALNRQLDKNNLCFLHAPHFHQALKKVAVVRKVLGTRTVFNGIGPLVNPAQPRFQLTGTYSLELARLYAHLLKIQEKEFCVVHGLDGFDELSFIGSTRIFTKNHDLIIEKSPNQQTLNLEELFGGNNAKEAAEICQTILSGKGSKAQNTVVSGNVALALQLFEPNSDYSDLFFQAENHLKSGKTIQTLQKQLRL